MEVKELGHLVLYVRNLERSAAFYRDVLGWRQLAPTDGSIGFPAAAFSAPSNRTHHELLLIEVGDDAAAAAPGPHVGLYHFGLKIGDTDDELRDALRAVQEAGATVVGASDHTVTHSLYILDPDGNEIELYVDVPGVDWKTDPALVLQPHPAAGAVARAVPIPSDPGAPRPGILDTGGANWSSPNQRIDHRSLVRPLPLGLPRLRSIGSGREHHVPALQGDGFGVGGSPSTHDDGGGHVDRWRGRAARLDADTKKLHELGYAQELRRRMSGFSNFAVSFTIISILSGCLTAYGIAMTNGGPVDMTWGWIFVGLMTTGRRSRHGRGVLGLSHRRRPLLLVGQAGQAQQGRLELVHRMVQPPRPGGRHRRHRLRLLPVLQRLPQPDHRLGGHPGPHRASSTPASSSSTPP